MRHHHSTQISPGRFPAHDGASIAPGMPKPRIHMPRHLTLSAGKAEVIR